MSNSITTTGSTYKVRGTVINHENNEGVPDLHVLLYDKDIFNKDDFLGIGVTYAAGVFNVSFNSSQFTNIIDRSPDIYFVIKDGGFELLNTKKWVIKNADESTPVIVLTVDLSKDKLRQDINETPAAGWVGGFAQSDPVFAYPTLDLTSLPMLKNLDNIDKLDRQQKVLWPEFSWNTEPGEADEKRCYQMFAPDISRLGYTKEGRVYSIICPQQGACSPNLGSMNVEVTVTGNRGWADEANKELAGDMTVEGRIWFSRKANENKLVKKFANDFKANGLSFPFNKANAIRISTYNPGTPNQPIFPLRTGPSTDFPIPEFAKHTSVAWALGHLCVEIGPIVKTGVDKVDEFNQLILDIFNIASGNMFKNGNILTWNVWFTAPEVVDQKEWAEHAEKWRQSIDSDHGSPEGLGTDARYFDGTPFKPLKELIGEELPRILSFVEKHL